MKQPGLIRASTLTLLAAALSAGAADTASAVTIYRCGPLRSAFSDRPCAGGETFEAEDARSDAQRADASRAAAMERQLAAHLQQERLRNAALQPSGAAGFDARPLRVATAPMLAIGRKHLPKPRLASSLTSSSTVRWVDDRERFIAFAPTAAGKPRDR